MNGKFPLGQVNCDEVQEQQFDFLVDLYASQVQVQELDDHCGDVDDDGDGGDGGG